MKKILLDTNFLIDLVKFKISLEEIENLVYEKYQTFIPSAVISELKRNPSKHARVALELIKNVTLILSYVYI